MTGLGNVLYLCFTQMNSIRCVYWLCPRFWGEQFDYTTQIVSIREGGIVARPKILVVKNSSRRRKSRTQKDGKTRDVESVENHQTKAEGAGLDEEAKTIKTKVAVDEEITSVIAPEPQGMLLSFRKGLSDGI